MNTRQMLHRFLRTADAHAGGADHTHPAQSQIFVLICGADWRSGCRVEEVERDFDLIGGCGRGAGRGGGAGSGGSSSSYSVSSASSVSFFVFKARNNSTTVAAVTGLCSSDLVSVSADGVAVAAAVSVAISRALFINNDQNTTCCIGLQQVIHGFDGGASNGSACDGGWCNAGNGAISTVSGTIDFRLSVCGSTVVVMT